jgi:riboflavin biosynthesis pyrimidine reductase
MASPLDGRLLMDPWAPKGDPLRTAVVDEYEYLHKKFAADAWLAGTNTMKEFAGDNAPGKADVLVKPQKPWHLADPKARHFAIAIDQHARLHWRKAIADEGHVVVVLGAGVSDAHLAELVSFGVSYLVMPADDIDLAVMLSELHDRLGIRKLLLEGGAKMNGAFLKAGLVDEISLVLCPAVDGKSGGSTIFEAGDESVGPKLVFKFTKATPLASGAVHLQYTVSSRPTA